MKRILFLMLAFLSFSVAVYGQSDAKSRINQVKKNPNYIYGEATLPTREEALASAKDVLVFNINSFVREKPDSVVLIPVSIHSVVDSCEVLETTRGSMARVLAFVHKSRICQMDEIEFEEKSRPSAKEEFEQSIVNIPDLFVMYDILDSETWSSRCKYGKVKANMNPEEIAESYLVIFSSDDYVISAVLAPKSENRRNLVTGTPDSTRNYPNCQAVWIKVVL